jgi:hypothetical protein
MTRYARQQDNFRCGPVGILNALKWSGVAATVDRTLPYLCGLTGCVDGGVRHREMDKALREAGCGHFTTRLVRRPKLHEIENHLKSGGAIIVNYYWEKKRRDYIETSRHYVLISDISPSGTYFGMVNYEKVRPTYQRVHRNTIKKHVLRYQRVDKIFKAWFLTECNQCGHPDERK